MELKFSGDVAAAVEATREVIQLVRDGKAHTKHAIDHAIFAAGHFHALRPDDDPDPMPPIIGSTNSVEDCCHALEAELPEVQDGKVVAHAFTPTDWYRLFQLAMELVDLLRKR